MNNNNLSALNNHLFEQLERLNDDELMEANGESELKRAKEISNISKQVVDIARVSIEGEKLRAEYGGGEYIKLPPMIE